MKDEINKWKNSQLYKLFKAELNNKRIKLMNSNKKLKMNSKNISWEELVKIINKKIDIYNTPLPQKIEIYDKSGVSFFYKEKALEELITEYVSTIVFFTIYLKKSVIEEKYEYSSLIRDFIHLEENEFIMNLILYHFPEDYNAKEEIDIIYTIIPNVHQKIFIYE